MAEIAICITTSQVSYQLQNLLDVLEAMGTRHSVSIIIAETNPGVAEPFKTSLGSPARRWPISIRSLPDANAARIRNALIAQAFDQGAPVFLVFLREFDMPQEGWLDGLIEAQRKSQADFVAGPVGALYEETVPEWIAGTGLFDRFPADEPLDWALAGFTNVLLRAGIFTQWRRPWFSPDVQTEALTDALFQQQLSILNTGFTIAPDAWSEALIPGSLAKANAICERAREYAAAQVAIEQPDKALLFRGQRLRFKHARCKAAAALASVLPGWPQHKRFNRQLDLAIARGALDGLRERDNPGPRKMGAPIMLSRS